MQAQLKAKALLWKNKALSATKKRRLLTARLKRSQQRVKQLEVELEQLRALSSPVRVPGHCYPAQMIALAVFIVVHANGSLRCAAKTIVFFAQLMGWNYSAPSHTTIRRWVLRCGLYKLNYSAEKTGEYVAILDESIQIGREKLLLMLGVKLSSQYSLSAPLTGQDVEVLGVEVQSSWASTQVASFIQRQRSRLPGVKLAYVITDRGGNLLKALQELGLPAVNDCTHMMMNAVKKLFKDNEMLSRLSADIGQLRRCSLLTAEGYLAPAPLRDKDRFLRILEIVKWVERIDAYWDNLPAQSRQKLSFIEQARPLVQCLAQIKTLIGLTADVLKYAGLSVVSRRNWEQRVADYSAQEKLAPQAQSFLQAVRAYFDSHAQLTDSIGRLLCCSDIIESTFGRYKNKGGTQVISSDVLSIALYNTDISLELVQKSLAAVPYQEVQVWAKRHTCDNRYSCLRRMDQELKSVAADGS